MTVVNFIKAAPIFHNIVEIARWRKTLADKGMPCAVVCGSFRIIHPGNLRCLTEAAAKVGNVCIVLEPGKENPAERAGLFALVRNVSAIVILPQNETAAALQSLKPFTLVDCPADKAPSESRKAARELAGKVHHIEPVKNCFYADIIAAVRSGRTPLKIEGNVYPEIIADSAAIKRNLHGLKDKKIVTVNGCFDILHVGHAHLLAEARKKGDALIVLVNDDISVRTYKGPPRPVFPIQFRLAALKALEPVTAAFPFSENEPLDVLALIRPAVHIKGGSFEEQRVQNEKKLLESWGGRIEFVPLVGSYSTSNLLDNLI
jgi:rfaE bifunctional protein nucleotidyltransferase chain/domain